MNKNCRKLKPVSEYMPLVYKIAKRVHGQVHAQADMDDLVSWGTMGLLEAMKRFDPDRGIQLSTFAYRRIHGAMIDGIGNVAPLARQCYRNARAAGDPHAIYRRHGETEQIVDPRKRISPSDFTERAQVCNQLEAAISKLSHEQQHLVRQHYFGNQSLMQAGKSLGISKSWASRSHKNALRALRASLQPCSVS